MSLRSILKYAIAYYRHSAEDKQENSVAIQRERVHAFAKEHGIKIIFEIADEGKSGLTANRPGFKKMFAEWILNSASQHFDFVLVLDVSRWGRFQNHNEPAYYEFQCNQKGAQVVYVDDGMPRPEDQFMTQIKVSIQRGMAAEYSKKLSEKVFYGSAKVSEQGFSAGGTACYGMDRLLLDEMKMPIGVLKDGDHKAISNQRVTFIPKKDATNATVKMIFDLFVNQNKSLEEIIETIDQDGAPPKKGGAWNRGKVLKVLSNETYIGTRLYNKTRNRLKTGKKRNDREQWVVCINAFPASVDEDVFWRAQEKLHWSNPSKWKKGIYVINKARRQLVEEYVNDLQDQGFDKITALEQLRNIPLMFAATYRLQSGIAHWCFLMNEDMRRHPFALGIGVTVNKELPIDKFFCIPTSSFGVGGSCVISEKDEVCSRWQLTEEQFRSRILKEINPETAS